jgi:hypothetical protein
MYITNYDIAKNLSNYVKNRPIKFNDCISKLVDKFILRLGLDIPDEEIIKLRIVYQFIFMYSLITRDLNTVKKIMRNSETITFIIKALVINCNLKLKHHQQLLDVMMEFGHNNNVILNSQNTIMLCCLYFDPAIFYEAIEYVTNIYCNEVE